MPSVDPRILPPPAYGTDYSSVFKLMEVIDDSMVKMWDLGQQQEMLLMGPWEYGDVTTIYNLRLVDHELMMLAPGPNTKAFDASRSPVRFSPRLVELCAGTGAMAVGPSFLGCHVVASADHTPLACQH